MYQQKFKRSFDFLCSITLFVLTSPVIIISSLLICLESKGPIFYTQIRLGKNGRLFKLYKLRSMIDKKRHIHHQVLPADSEVTKVGKIIRRLKIDELPQLFNVIKGDMSFVGPRPCLPELSKRFNQDGFMRLKLAPGLTGLSQINGNIYLTWPERWKYDRIYVERCSFGLDLYILIKTFRVIFYGERKHTE